MPVYSIQVPDGRTVDIQADLPTQAMLGAQDWYSQQKAASQTAADNSTLGGDAGTVNPLLSSTLNTALLNAPRALQAGIDTVRGQSAYNGKKVGSYSEAMDNVNAIEDAKGRQHPIATGVGTAAGIAAPIAATLMTGGAAAPLAEESLANLGMQTVKSAATGGAMGAANEGFKGDYANMGQGALAGAALGAVIPGVIAGGTKAAGLAVDALRPSAAVDALTPHGQQAQDIAETVRGMHADSKAGVDAAYAASNNQPGEFAPGSFNNLKNTLTDTLASRNSDPTVNPPAWNAADVASRVLSTGGSSLQDVDNARRFLSNAANSAGNQADKGHIYALKDALDSHVNGLIGDGKFSGPQSSVDAITNARQTAAQHYNFFNSDDAAGKTIQSILDNPDLTQQQLSAKIFGGDSLTPGGLSNAAALSNRLQSRIDPNTPQGHALLDQLRQGAISKIVGDGNYSDTQLSKRVQQYVNGNGMEAANSLFNTTQKAALLNAVKDPSRAGMWLRGILNGAANTGSLPWIGMGHGVIGGAAGLALKTGAQMLKTKLAGNTTRDIQRAVSPAPMRPPMPPAPTMQSNAYLPVGIGYMGGVGAGQVAPPPQPSGLLG